ncbi:complement C1s subcomponent isoform X2 [Bombina bombina]|uniref:complement C1s subcomponent isoform X2 n=1 Tax=Bombina bombina TaxID=8345 RepID=UPI00235B2692|nr:complement C1s subcomponent isoform X2 [Bombina bombina]
MGMRVLLFLTLLGCVSATYPQMHGEIISPNYPQGYPSSIHKSWNISVPLGFGIRLYFIHLDIEPSENCAYDYVQVIVGGMNELKLCGRKSEEFKGAPIQEKFYPTDFLTIEFHSDFSNQERYTGFAAYYSAVGNCSGGMFTEMRGQISSPRYPAPYLENAQCVYRVRLELGFQVILHFQARDFDIEESEDGNCTYDSLMIRARGRTLGVFCGSRPPPQIMTGSNEVDIIFQTDNGGENRGWRLHYSEDAIPCPVPAMPYAVLEPQKDRYVFRDVIVITCKTGFEIMQDKKNHPSIRSVCQANGKWSNVDWQCQPVDCGPPEDIDMGTVTFNQTTYDMTIKYSCISEYYRMILDQPGDGTYHCSSEGIWVDSLGREKLPKCEAVCGIASNPLVSMSRIFGGSKAAPGNFPWMIRFHNPNFGGGALISDQWILTAAHVMQDNDNPKMYGGLINLRKRYKHLLEAKNVFIHPHFNLNAETTKNYNNDIALVQLIRKVKMGPCISPICLPQKGASSSLQPGKIGYIAGWGMTESSNQDWARDLLYASIPISRLDKCSSIKDAVLTENMMCAGDLGKDSCSGDSGGPFMFEDPQDPNRQFVGGIVSWGSLDCGNFGLYTKVENYLDWIEETIRDNEDEEENEPYDVCA